MTEKDIKQYIKKVRGDANKDMERYLGSLNEHTDDRFKAIKEGQDGVNERLEKMQGDIDNITLELRDTKLKVHDISYNMNLTLDKKVDKKLFLDLDSRVRILEKNK